MRWRRGKRERGRRKGERVRIDEEGRGRRRRLHLELSVAAADRDGDVVAHDLSGDHGEGLALSGVDLARHDAAAGLILRQVQLP